MYIHTYVHTYMISRLLLMAYPVRCTVSLVCVGTRVLQTHLYRGPLNCGLQSPQHIKTPTQVGTNILTSVMIPCCCCCCCWQFACTSVCTSDTCIYVHMKHIRTYVHCHSNPYECVNMCTYVHTYVYTQLPVEADQRGPQCCGVCQPQLRGHPPLRSSASPVDVLSKGTQTLQVVSTASSLSY